MKRRAGRTEPPDVARAIPQQRSDLPIAADRHPQSKNAPACRDRYTIRVRSALMCTLVTVIVSGCHRQYAPGIGAVLLRDAGRVEAAALSQVRRADLELAARDPLAFLGRCIEHYDRTITNYRCTFVVRERLRGTLGPEQVMAIKFRKEPFSVDVRWLSGWIGASRVNYVAGRSSLGGKERAHVEPSGWLGLVTPGGVMRPIHAWDMMAAARRPIDQFGFRNTLDLFVRACEQSAGEPEFELRFLGLERFDGHPCFLLERQLPYDRSRQTCPDRLQRIYVDVTWLVPRASFAYADDAGEILLGSYIAREIEFNVGLVDDDFAVRPPHADR